MAVAQRCRVPFGEQSPPLTDKDVTPCQLLLMVNASETTLLEATPMKMAFVSTAALAVLTASCVTTPASPVEEAIVFKAQSGEITDAFHGSFRVPENRNDPNSRIITLRYVRFPGTSANPGSPIVYLAGGPGGSGIGTAEERRFPLFMAMREFGDVIALDQRGTGESDDTPTCEPVNVASVTEPMTDEVFAATQRAASIECAAFWKTKGIDLAGYNTVQSAKDLDALRRHLGAKKITLWGISYGTHLALAALKEMDDHIDRVVLASAEGLDQTVKLPARTDAYFDRLQAAVDSQPNAKAAYPDIKALIKRVHKKLDAKPVMLSLKGPDGKKTELLLQRRHMQQVAGATISDPERAVLVLGLYASIDAGDYGPISAIMQRYFSPGEPEKLRAMPLAMDVASGISTERLALVEQQARMALLGDYLNFPMPQLRSAFPQLDLGGAFRSAPQSRVPTLLFTGTLDGRTYPDSHKEAVAGLKNLQAITVVNAGHNLFMSSPEVTAAIQRFMRGEPAKSQVITIPLPDFLPAKAKGN